MKGLKISRANLIIAIIAVVAVFATGVVLSGLLGHDAHAESDASANRRTINVSGTAKVTVVPDIAYVTLGVVTEDADANAAQTQNAELMDKVVKAIKAAGVDEADIKTRGYSLSPKYDYNRDTGESRIIGYTVSNTVEVTVRKVEDTGKVIDAGSDAGANVSNGIRFGLSDNEKYYQEALAKAVAVARERAEAIAGALNVSIKRPYEVNESGSNYPGYINWDYAKAAEAERMTPIEPGTLDVNASVSIRYEY